MLARSLRPRQHRALGKAGEMRRCRSWKELEQIDSLNGTGKKAVAVKVEDLALEQLSPVACLILVLTGKCGQLSIPLVSHLETHQLD